MKMARENNTSGHNESKGWDPYPSVADVPNSILPTKDVDESKRQGSELAAKRFVADGGCDSVEGTTDGKVGEWAFAQYLPGNREPDSEVRPNGDGGSDFNWGGWTWDVKSVGQHVDSPDLMVDAQTRLRADRYALISRIGRNTCRIVGYTPRHGVKEQPIRLNEYGRPYRRVPRDKLVPFPPVLSD